MKRKYSLEEFTNILKTLKDENPCYTCNCLSVSSSDNFNLEIISCKKNTKLMDVSFGGGWGLGWNITNFHFH